MSLCIEIQVNSSNAIQQREIIDQIRDVVSGMGFHIDQSTYTPSEATLSELAGVADSRATIKTFEV